MGIEIPNEQSIAKEKSKKSIMNEYKIIIIIY